MTETRLSLDTQSDDELEAIVHQLDPDLEYVRDLHAEGSTCRTLLVRTDGTDCTFKVRKLSRNVWDDMYFYYEIHALRRAGERNLKGITRLLQEYRDDRFHAILKTFAPGTPGNKADMEDLLHSREFIRKLDSIYLRLHLAGIARINFLPRKIVIGDDGELTLVDLSTCIVNTESGIELFVQAMKEDSRFITRLEKNATH